MYSVLKAYGIGINHYCNANTTDYHYSADGTSLKVRYSSAAQYASTGKTNCYPDMGSG